MLTMESKSQNSMTNSLPSNPADAGQQPNSTSMNSNQLLGQNMSDMQQQRQLGQHNILSNLQQQPQQQLMGQTITDAVVTLKEKTGSSQQAIQKFIEQKQKNLSPSFRKLILFHLKKLVADGKLVKVKGSYKLPAAKPKPAKKPAAAKPKVKPKTAATKPKAKAVAKPKVKAAAKPKAKAAAKPKAKAAVKPKAKAAAKPKAKAVVKPKAKAVVKPKAKAAVKPKAKVATKPKAKAVLKPKAKAAAKPAAKVARTSTRTSPGKKVPAAKPKAVTPKKSAVKGKKAVVVKKTPARKAKK